MPQPRTSVGLVPDRKVCHRHGCDMKPRKQQHGKERRIIFVCPRKGCPVVAAGQGSMCISDSFRRWAMQMELH